MSLLEDTEIVRKELTQSSVGTEAFARIVNVLSPLLEMSKEELEYLIKESSDTRDYVDDWGESSKASTWSKLNYLLRLTKAELPQCEAIDKEKEVTKSSDAYSIHDECSSCGWIPCMCDQQ